LEPLPPAFLVSPVEAAVEPVPAVPLFSELLPPAPPSATTSVLLKVDELPLAPLPVVAFALVAATV
jgi:hypothetical protein